MLQMIFLCLFAQIMKNIFHQSFNVYKTDIEPRLNDVTLHHMQCSRRLFEIQLSHRRISAAFIEGDNVAVTVEGEAARVLNFDTGTSVYNIPVTVLLRTGEDIFAQNKEQYSDMCHLFYPQSIPEGETNHQVEHRGF